MSGLCIQVTGSLRELDTFTTHTQLPGPLAELYRCTHGCDGVQWAVQFLVQPVSLVCVRLHPPPLLTRPGYLREENTRSVPSA